MNDNNDESTEDNTEDSLLLLSKEDLVQKLWDQTTEIVGYQTTVK